MCNVLVNESTLVGIANAIREKNGKEILYRPAEMPDAILDIKTTADEKPIKFYGYKGEVVYSYDLEEIEQMIELPAFPEVEGMICQEWNWTLEELKNHKREANVGAIFTTDDGSTRIYISLVEGALNPLLGFAQASANSVWVDWGDGSPLETSGVYGTSTSVEMMHQYATAGDYIIRLIPEEEAQIYLLGDSKGTGLLRKETAISNANYVYSNAIKKVELGRCIAYINNYAFAGNAITLVNLPNDVEIIKGVYYGASALEYAAVPRKFNVFPSYMFGKCNCIRTICVPGNLIELGAHCFANCSVLDNLTLPDSLTISWSYTWYYCKGLRKLIIPKGLKKIKTSDFSNCETLKTVIMHEEIDDMGSGPFYYCERLKEVSIPDGVTKIGNQTFMYCSTLQKVSIPESVVEIGMNAFGYCYGLSELIIPQNVITIGASAFNNTLGMEHFYFLPVVPPTLTSKNTFNYIPSTCKIHIPKGSLEAYQTAEYWNEYADYMVEMEE